MIDRVGGLVDVARHEHHRRAQRHQRQRDRHQEHRAPLERLQQGPGHERAERRDTATDRGPQRDRLRPSRPRPERGDQRESGREGHAGRDATEQSRDDQHLDGRRRRGDDGCGHGQRHPQYQHHLAPVPVAECSEVEHRTCKPYRVADGNQVELRLARVERLADVRQRDIRDRQVQVRHSGDEDQRRQDEWGPSGTSPRRCGCHPASPHHPDRCVARNADAAPARPGSGIACCP